MCQADREISDKPVVLALMGPTASGKTDLAMALARELPFDIISVDSALVYCGLDVGTAKPRPEVLSEIPHRLIDIRDPAEPYSAAEFRIDALREIRNSHRRGRIPLLVGGTMLYYKFLLQGSANLPTADANIRRQILAWVQDEGWLAVHRRLAKVDTDSASRIHPSDTQRLQRALEIYLASGKTMTEHLAEQVRWVLPFELLQLAVCPSNRQVLHERIAERFRHMLAQGLVTEVAHLYARGDLHLGLPAIRSVGYRQVWDYHAGNLNYAEMVERGIIATRQLAKRQMTWLKSWQGLEWFRSDDPGLHGHILRWLQSVSVLV